MTTTTTTAIVDGGLTKLRSSRLRHEGLCHSPGNEKATSRGTRYRAKALQPGHNTFRGNILRRARDGCVSTAQQLSGASVMQLYQYTKTLGRSMVWVIALFWWLMAPHHYPWLKQIMPVLKRPARWRFT